MNRKELLEDKARMLEITLAQWAGKQGLLQKGERLLFKLRIVKEIERMVHGIVQLPEGEGGICANIVDIEPRILSISVHTLGLSGRPLNLLINNGCAVAGDFLQNQKYEDFGKWRNAGPSSYIEIRDAFQKIGIKLPWPISLRKNPDRKTIQQLENERVQAVELKEEDWGKILSVRWESYQLPTIEWFRDHKNTPARAETVLEFIGMGKMYSFTTINDKFRRWKLAYRLRVSSKPTTIPSRMENRRCYPGALICIGKLPE